jgi:hypothetical protein
MAITRELVHRALEPMRDVGDEKKSSTIRNHCLGSNRFARFIEPLTSANRTVMCLRSPSSADSLGKSCRPRCLGVYVRGPRARSLAAGLLADAAAGTAAPSATMASSSRRRCPTKVYTWILEILCRQARQHSLVDLVIAEGRHIELKAQILLPRCHVLAVILGPEERQPLMGPR